MRRGLALVIGLVEGWSVLLLLALVGIVVVGVFFRYVLDASLAWYDEFASYLLVWLTFSGAVAVSYRRRHISFDTLVERLGPGPRRLAGVVAELLVLALQAVLAYFGWVALEAMAFDSAVSIPWVRMTWIYSVMPIAGALMLVVSIVRLADLIAGRDVPVAGPTSHGTAD